MYERYQKYLRYIKDIKGISVSLGAIGRTVKDADYLKTNLEKVSYIKIS